MHPRRVIFRELVEEHPTADDACIARITLGRNVRDIAEYSLHQVLVLVPERKRPDVFPTFFADCAEFCFNLVSSVKCLALAG